MRKRMKNVAVMFIGFALTGAVLAGCGESRQSRQDTQQGIPTSISEENGQDSVAEKAETDEAERAEPDNAEKAGADAAEKAEPDNAEKAGADAAEKAETDVTEKAEADEADQTEKTTQTSERYEDNFAVDSKAAKEFAKKVKAATAQKDLEALAELTAFPVYVGLPDAGVVETREDFLNLGAEAVFTDELLESIEMADIENFEPCMAGFPISDGRTASINFGVVDGILAINGINY